MSEDLRTELEIYDGIQDRHCSVIEGIRCKGI